MKKWRVVVNGTNFKLEMQEDDSKSRVRRMGFFTTVFVAARTPEEAESRAVAMLRHDRSLRIGARNAKDDPPALFVEEIREIASFHGCRRPRAGLALYAERGQKRKS